MLISCKKKKKSLGDRPAGEIGVNSGEMMR